LISEADIRFEVEWRAEGVNHRDHVVLPRELFLEAEQLFQVSPDPHRELLSSDRDGKLIGSTLLATMAHGLHGLDPRAKDLVVVYVGKGLCSSAQDRLRNHSTLQEILEDLNSKAPDRELFAIVYRFEYKRHLVINVPPEGTPQRAKRLRTEELRYSPTLDDQISLVEAACISYFHPSRYNSQYLNFPQKTHKILREPCKAGVATISVNLDNASVGGLRIGSETVPASEFHSIRIELP
jgi:hypothetical protein